MILVMYSNFVPSSEHLERLVRESAGMTVHAVQSEEDASRQARNAEIILGHRYLRQTLALATNVRWVQATAAGMDQIITPELRRRGPLLTRSTASVHATALHALSLALALMRRLPEAIASQRRGRVERPANLLPIPRNALVVGLGAIGRELATLLRSAGLRVAGVARSYDQDKARSCDELILDDGWRERLGETDWLFVTLPLDDDTRGIIDASVLAALPAHAVVVSVSRGECVDLRAAAEALREGRLGGVAVDATDHLPDSGDPIWQTPGLLHTPKIASLHPGFQAQIECFVEAQVGRYFRGESLLNAVEYARE